MHKPLYGLVLVGGESRRMGQDKALLSYDGKQTQIERSVSLLNEVCANTFVSMRQEQDYAIPDNAAVLYDSDDAVKGPLCGILSAMAAHPEADWLIIACDLPNLKTSDLQNLITAYHAEAPRLTAYRSSYDQLPEPLCAIYPAGKDTELLALAQELGKFCPRKLLIIKATRLIEQANPHSLDNINTPDELSAQLDKQTH
ncbi:MAG: NTP transferase domain-containing protein [Verrucomicrobiota bacterium]